MLNPNEDLLKQAEEFEKQSKNEIKIKNYNAAISLLFKAKDIYSQLGLTGQVGMLLKEIVRLKNLTTEAKEISSIEKGSSFTKEKIPPLDAKNKMEVYDKKVLESKGTNLLEEARIFALKNELDEAINLYNKALDIFKKIDYNYEVKQILWQITEIKKYQKWNKSHKSKANQISVKDIVALAAAERRRLKIQHQLEEDKRESQISKIDETKIKSEEKKDIFSSYKLFKELTAKEKLKEERKNRELKLLQEQQEQRKQEARERQNKLKIIREQKRKEETARKTVEKYLNEANQLVQKKKYDDAKSFYKKAIEIFTDMKWYNQVKILRQELWNIERYKKEYERKLELEVLARQKSEKQFEKRIEEMKSDYEKSHNERVEKIKTLPPQIKAKLEKIELIKDKANKEESLNKLNRVLDRYKYIIKLYLSIPKDVIDLSDEITNIHHKISELENKL